MKEILFKAKRKGRADGSDYISPYKNGDWVYGLVSKQYKGHWADEFDDEMTDENGISGITIDRNTICEYTGFDDGLGQKIFDGDRLMLIDEDDTYYVAQWGDCYQALHDKFPFIPEMVFMNKRLGKVASTSRVIGNICDNIGVKVKDDDI